MRAHMHSCMTANKHAHKHVCTHGKASLRECSACEVRAVHFMSIGQAHAPCRLAAQTEPTQTLASQEISRPMVPRCRSPGARAASACCQPRALDEFFLLCRKNFPLFLRTRIEYFPEERKKEDDTHLCTRSCSNKHTHTVNSFVLGPAVINTHTQRGFRSSSYSYSMIL
jgi:hypothetical protein